MPLPVHLLQPRMRSDGEQDAAYETQKGARIRHSRQALGQLKNLMTHTDPSPGEGAGGKQAQRISDGATGRDTPAPPRILPVRCHGSRLTNLGLPFPQSLIAAIPEGQIGLDRVARRSRSLQPRESQAQTTAWPKSCCEM